MDCTPKNTPSTVLLDMSVAEIDLGRHLPSQLCCVISHSHSHDGKWPPKSIPMALMPTGTLLVTISGVRPIYAILSTLKNDYRTDDYLPVSYTHLTLPTIYLV